MFFVVLVAGIWIASLAAWVVVSKAFRSADVDKMKSRILDTEQKKQKKARTGK